VNVEDFQQRIGDMQQRVAQILAIAQQNPSSPHQQEAIITACQELTTALAEFQVPNSEGKALQQLNEELEERVTKRTAALQQVNEQLQNEIAEHQQTLNALRWSEERFRHAIVHAPIPIMIHAEDGEVIQINQVWTDITGYTQIDIPTIADWTQRAYGERHEAVKAWIDQLYERDRSIDEGEFAVTTRHGETRIWHFCSAPLGQLPDGKRLVISMARDITDRRQVETALQENERRLSELATNIPGAIYQFVRHTDGSYSIPYISPGSHRVFELEASEIEENSAVVVNLIHPDDRQSFDDSVIASAETLDTWHWEGRFIMPSGELKWLRGASCPQKQANGNVLWDGLLMDITSCKNIELALQESELRFRQLADNISQVFWVATPDLSQILYVSPACERVWGRSQASVYAQPDSWLNGIIHPDDRDRVVASLETMKLEEQDQEYRIVRSDGTIRWIRDRSFPVRDEQGRIYRIAGIAEDITSRQLAEVEMATALEQERELGELKSNFIAIASHQFRTPLTTIASSAELLERYRDRLSQEKQLTHLSRIQTAVGQMAQLLDDVLLVGKAGAGKLEFNPTPTDVVQFCQDLVEELQLSDKNQHIITFVHQGNCTKAVEGTVDLLPLFDEKYLRHIFDNLLSNAIKYSPHGTRVRFELTDFGDRAVFHVQDEGIGVPPEDLPRLFESFHRARNVGTIQGTGLGLAIVKQCVDLLGGELLVNSEVGKGTTFTVTLPLHYSV
jgi:PAS domain S-box-containing protein